MKLCPECDFIYEDDQCVCDMDGKELVSEPTLTKFPGNSIRSNVPPAPTRFLRSQNIAVTAMAAVVLVATLFLVYYVLTQRASAAKPAVAPTSTSNPVRPIPRESVSPAAVATPLASPSIPEGSESESSDPQRAKAAGTFRAEQQPLPHSLSPNDKSAAMAKASPSLSITALPTVEPLPQLKPLPKLAAQNTTKKPNQATASHRAARVKPKKESRVGSFLKKTARILKKPFER